ncbi:hypothetical protein VPHK356_0119 [Vibrio phage K356]|nr:hypothetical protein MYOV002v2_p0111 [Vibrio phage 144E46.1]
MCERMFPNISPYIGAGLLAPAFMAVVIFVAVMTPSHHGSEYRGY